LAKTHDELQIVNHKVQHDRDIGAAGE
jgi:hypothetical protein